MKKSFEDLYKEGILEAYEAAREDVHSDFLLDPSPAHLRNLCQLLWEDGLDKNDEQAFRKFFGYVTVEEGLQRIKNSDLDKLKPVQRFFLRQSTLSKPEAINLAAVLVNRENRPYAKFIKTATGTGGPTSNFFSDQGISGESKIVGTTAVDDIQPLANKRSSNEDHNTSQLQEQYLINIDKRGNQTSKNPLSTPPFPQRMPVLKIAVYLLVIVPIVLGLWKFSAPKCMAWKGHHYEIVDCDAENAGKTIPYNEVVLSRMHKILPTDTTTYFRNGKPIVWYSKQDNIIEFFSYHGVHPITGKTLKAVTRHIVDKHAE